MNNGKSIARLVGVLFIVGTAAGILSAVFTGSILESADLLAEVSANENRVILGTLFVLIMGISLALVPVVVYPILRECNEALALGYVVFRGALETFAYIVTAISWLSLVALSKGYASAVSPDNMSLQNMSRLLLGVGEQTNSITMILFSLGALMFYYLLYQSRLIPKWLSGWGLVAASIYLAAGVSALFGAQLAIALLPLALQEMVMAVWLIAKGFNPSAIASEA